MGDQILSTRHSLDRLKALNSLPDLASQLEEAKQLCNHSARADMTCKWLLETLKSTEDARASLEAWKALQSTLRLLSPERVATLLASHDFIGICKTALEDTEHADTLISAQKDILNFLIDSSNGPNGTHIKAVLSLPSSNAASFLGAWLRSIFQVIKSAVNHTSNDSIDSLLRPGIEIWNLRKHSAEEHDQFAKQCLVPAARLLTVLPIEVAQQHSKRRHEETEMSQLGIKRVVESLIARHVFLPARSAYFKTQDVGESNKRRQVGSQNPAFVINVMLEQLKEIGNVDNYPHPLPLLLDVALRCAQLSTPRQRLKERPWIETVFDALHKCNTKGSGEVIDRTALTKLLAVVGQHTVLSKEVIEGLVKRHSGLGHASDDDQDWLLIAQVIELDSDVFAGTELADVLFADLTTCIEKFCASTQADTPSEEFKSLSKDRIVVPIMRAFARRRNLTAFVELWARQLQHDQHNELWSVWTELDDEFATLLEDSLTERLIQDLFDQFCLPITSTSELPKTELDPAFLSKLSASIVVLKAILGGIRSEALVDALQGRVENLFTAMLKLCEQFSDDTPRQQISAAHDNCSWALLTKAFELWFPAWAAREADADAIAERGVSIVESSAVRNAIAFAKRIRQDNKASANSKRTAYTAEVLVASLCSHLYKYDAGLRQECWVACGDLINGLVYQLDPMDVKAILSYPDLISVASDGGPCNDFIITCITAASSNRDQLKAASAHQALLALSKAAVKLGQPGVVDEFVQVIMNWLESDEGEGDDDNFPAVERVLLDMIFAFPVDSLTRPQRERIINGVVGLGYHTEAIQGQQLQKRLAVLVKLMAVPNATSLLSTDHTAIWRFAHPLSTEEETDSRKSHAIHTAMQEPSTLLLLETLVKLILSHLLANQDQERSRSILIQLSADVQKHVDLICDNDDTENYRSILATLRPIISQLEAGSGGYLKALLPHRDARTIEPFVRKLCIIASAGLLNICGYEHDIEQIILLNQTLLTLLCIPDSPDVKMDIFTGVLKRNLEGAVDPCLALSWVETTGTASTANQEFMQALKVAIASSYELRCKHASPEECLEIASLAIKIVKMQLQPREYNALIVAFKQYLQSLASASKAKLLQELLLQHQSPDSSVLLLAHVCITELEASNVDDTTAQTSHGLMPKLLSIAVESKDLVITRRAVSCILTVLKEKSFITNQYNIEAIVQALPKLLCWSSSAPVIYIDVCRIMSTLFLQYRSRLQGRFHMIIQVFQELISRLFRSTNRQSTNEFCRRDLTAKHARALARLLALFCEPPQLRRPQKASGLVDESRKEQAHVGQYVQFVLHHYCAQVLAGTLAEGVREALTPGLWSMIEAIQINDADGTKSLSAAMNNSERAVLRSVYEDWRRFGKWRGA